MRVPELRPSLPIAAAGVVAAVLLAAPSAPVAMRAAAAVALGFLLPGAGLLAGLMPRARTLRSERIAVAVGGSIASTIGIAFLLHALPSGLTPGSWAAALGGLTVAGSALGWLRTRDRVSVAGPWTEGAPTVGARGLPAPATVAMLAAAGVLVALSLVIARSGTAFGPKAAFTELWMLPVDGGSAVRLGVANHEGDRRTYRLEVTVDGRPLREPVSITLEDDAATDVVLDLQIGGRRARIVEGRLWQADQARGAPPHREVQLLVRPARDDIR